ncbi:MAG: hydrolase [Planctomycetota bacterium]
MNRKLAVYIDVDDTLIRSVGSTRIPLPASVEYVRRMHAAGHAVYCWSRGGGDYAREVADSLGIAQCFVAFLPKPDVCLDDRGELMLDDCEIILPGNAPNH